MPGYNEGTEENAHLWCGVLCLYILILVFVNNDTVMLWVAILRLCCVVVVVVELQCGGWSVVVKFGAGCSRRYGIVYSYTP